MFKDVFEQLVTYRHVDGSVRNIDSQVLQLFQFIGTGCVYAVFSFAFYFLPDDMPCNGDVPVQGQVKKVLYVGEEFHYSLGR